MSDPTPHEQERALDSLTARVSSAMLAACAPSSPPGAAREAHRAIKRILRAALTEHREKIEALKKVIVSLEKVRQPWCCGRGQFDWTLSVFPNPEDGVVWCQGCGSRWAPTSAAVIREQAFLQDQERPLRIHRPGPGVPTTAPGGGGGCLLLLVVGGLLWLL